MRFEFSAGGIVFKRQKTLDTSQKIEILLCQHSQHHGWGFPKGLIGDGSTGSPRAKESKEEAALREVEEETGAKGKILAALKPVTFWYVFKGEKVKKTVYYYVMEYMGGDITDHDFEMESVEWVDEKMVLDRLTFKTDKQVFEEALPIIRSLTEAT